MTWTTFSLHLQSTSADFSTLSITVQQDATRSSLKCLQKTLQLLYISMQNFLPSIIFNVTLLQQWFRIIEAQLHKLLYVHVTNHSLPPNMPTKAPLILLTRRTSVQPSLPPGPPLPFLFHPYRWIFPPCSPRTRMTSWTRRIGRRCEHRKIDLVIYVYYLSWKMAWMTSPCNRQRYLTRDGWFLWALGTLVYRIDRKGEAVHNIRDTWIEWHFQESRILLLYILRRR